MIKTSSSSNVVITFFLHLSLPFHCLVWFGPWTTIALQEDDSNLCYWCRVSAWKMGTSLFTLLLSLLLVATWYIYISRFLSCSFCLKALIESSSSFICALHGNFHGLRPHYCFLPFMCTYHLWPLSSLIWGKCTDVDPHNLCLTWIHSTPTCMNTNTRFILSFKKKLIPRNF